MLAGKLGEELRAEVAPKLESVLERARGTLFLEDEWEVNTETSESRRGAEKCKDGRSSLHMEYMRASFILCRV